MFGGYKLEWIDFKFIPVRSNVPAKLLIVRREDYKVYKNMEVKHGDIKLFIHERDRYQDFFVVKSSRINDGKTHLW